MKNSPPVPGVTLSPISEGYKPGLKIENPVFWIRQNRQSGKLQTHRLKMRANCEKRKLLAKQNHQKAQSEGIRQNDLENPSRFIIDYMPLCCEEDLEMLASSIAKDQVEKPD